MQFMDDRLTDYSAGVFTKELAVPPLVQDISGRTYLFQMSCI